MDNKKKKYKKHKRRKDDKLPKQGLIEGGRGSLSGSTAIYKQAYQDVAPMYERENNQIPKNQAISTNSISGNISLNKPYNHEPILELEGTLGSGFFSSIPRVRYVDDPTVIKEEFKNFGSAGLNLSAGNDYFKAGTGVGVNYTDGVGFSPYSKMGLEGKVPFGKKNRLGARRNFIKGEAGVKLDLGKQSPGTTEEEFQTYSNQNSNYAKMGLGIGRRVGKYGNGEFQLNYEKDFLTGHGVNAKYIQSIGRPTKRKYALGGILPPDSSGEGLISDIQMTQELRKKKQEEEAAARDKELNTNKIGDVLMDTAKLYGSSQVNALTGMIGMNDVWNPEYDSGFYKKNEDAIDMGSKIYSGLGTAAGSVALGAITGGASTMAQGAIKQGVQTSGINDQINPIGSNPNSIDNLGPDVAGAAGKDYYMGNGGPMKSYADGGVLSEIMSGGSHEENPNGGVQIGNKGMVEEGETRWEDFIFSDRIKVDPNHLKDFPLPSNLGNKTYAEASKLLDKLVNPHKLTHNKRVNETVNKMYQRLADAQESQKLMEQMKEMQNSPEFLQEIAAMQGQTEQGMPMAPSPQPGMAPGQGLPQFAGGGNMNEMGVDVGTGTPVPTTSQKLIHNILNMIAIAEAPTYGYNSYKGIGKDKTKYDFSNMTIGEVKAWHKKYPKAVGRYQFIPETFNNVTKRLGYSDEVKFSPEIQDAMAIDLLREKGIDELMAGKITPHKFLNKIATVWAGLPVAEKTNREGVEINPGQSYYQGDKWGNEATISLDSALSAFNAYGDPQESNVPISDAIPQERETLDIPKMPIITPRGVQQGTQVALDKEFENRSSAFAYGGTMGEDLINGGNKKNNGRVADIPFMPTKAYSQYLIPNMPLEEYDGFSKENSFRRQNLVEKEKMDWDKTMKEATYASPEAIAAQEDAMARMDLERARMNALNLIKNPSFIPKPLGVGAERRVLNKKAQSQSEVAQEAALQTTGEPEGEPAGRVPDMSGMLTNNGNIGFEEFNPEKRALLDEAAMAERKQAFEEQQYADFAERQRKKGILGAAATGVGAAAPIIGNILAASKLSKPEATAENKYDSPLISEPADIEANKINSQEGINRIENEASAMRRAVNRTSGASRSAAMAGQVGAYLQEAGLAGQTEMRAMQYNAAAADKAKQLNLSKTLQIAQLNANILANNARNRLDVKNMNDQDAQTYENIIANLYSSTGQNISNIAIDASKLAMNPTDYDMFGTSKEYKRSRKEEKRNSKK
jgi:muramidase (phage lysozyme)